MYLSIHTYILPRGLSLRAPGRFLVVSYVVHPALKRSVQGLGVELLLAFSAAACSC